VNSGEPAHCLGRTEPLHACPKLFLPVYIYKEARRMIASMINPKLV
jgi:hypothetical protein